MKERDVVKSLKVQVASRGGEARKVHWEGRSSAPDWLVWFPKGQYYPTPISAFFEAKASGKEPTQSQLREHERMRLGGLRVFVVASPEEITEKLDLLSELAALDAWEG